ncbi:hypothetical protein [Maricaulis sp.]|uniref:hypothetical protein n=1 Tax=Maricaulis sp. TaxID=1486257 RepID=UPI001B2BC608|nr:hypothetical protein [Maricaulis sp.]MBO6764616.1 hypothetical protein [Maricaulis sp.]
MVLDSATTRLSDNISKEGEAHIPSFFVLDCALVPPPKATLQPFLFWFIRRAKKRVGNNP